MAYIPSKDIVADAVHFVNLHDNYGNSGRELALYRRERHWGAEKWAIALVAAQKTNVKRENDGMKLAWIEAARAAM